LHIAKEQEDSRNIDRPTWFGTLSTPQGGSLGGGGSRTSGAAVPARANQLWTDHDGRDPAGWDLCGRRTHA